MAEPADRHRAGGDPADAGANGHAAAGGPWDAPAMPELVHVGAPDGDAARCGADDGPVAAWARVADPDDAAYFTCDACHRDVAEGRRGWL